MYEVSGHWNTILLQLAQEIFKIFILHSTSHLKFSFSDILHSTTHFLCAFTDVTSYTTPFIQRHISVWIYWRDFFIITYRRFPSSLHRRYTSFSSSQVAYNTPHLVLNYLPPTSPLTWDVLLINTSPPPLSPFRDVHLVFPLIPPTWPPPLHQDTCWTERLVRS